MAQHARWRARDAGDEYDGGDDGAACGGDGVHLSSSSHTGSHYDGAGRAPRAVDGHGSKRCNLA